MIDAPCGLLIILSGPSGGGKGTISALLREQNPKISYSVSCTTRPMRPGDVEGETYFFISREEFEKKIAGDEFLEHAFFYNTYYGTPRSFVERTLSAGNDCLVEIDPNGASQILEKMPKAVSIYLLPPSMKALLFRLENRGTESSEAIKLRFGEAMSEMRQLPLYKYAVINDDLPRALAAVQTILAAEHTGADAPEYYSSHLQSHLKKLEEEQL